MVNNKKLILFLRTDSALAHIGLVKDKKLVDEVFFESHRTLSEILIPAIEKLMKKNKCDYRDLGGVVIYRGPGSFMGLRIGHAVANSIAFAVNISIVGVAKTNRNDWWKIGLKKLSSSHNSLTPQYVLPFYGRKPNITKPKKNN